MITVTVSITVRITVELRWANDGDSLLNAFGLR